jgi:arylamine N-acetyltransferase
MIILKVIFTEDEIRQFFEGNGYKCEMRDFGEWRNTTHNNGEFVQISRLAVVLPNGRHTLASKLFEQVTEARIKKQIAPVNLEVQRLIEMTYKLNLKTE